jgi:hypothetical protein
MNRSAFLSVRPVDRSLRYGLGAGVRVLFLIVFSAVRLRSHGIVDWDLFAILLGILFVHGAAERGLYIVRVIQDRALP